MTSRKQQFMVFFGYPGQNFHGVALQPDVYTAGAALMARLAHATAQTPHAVSFAARTDAGVTALQNLATFRLVRPIGVEAVISALQAAQADGLTRVVAYALPRRVMARHMAAEKHYCYRVAGPCAPVADAAQTWHLATPFSVARLRRALAHFCGNHDFSAFCHGPRVTGNSRRTIRRIDVETQNAPQPGAYSDDAEVAIHIYGDGFLRRMLRKLVFTALEAACGLRAVASVPTLLQHGGADARPRVHSSAAARGLTLVRLTLTPQAQAICELAGIKGTPTMCQGQQFMPL